MSVNELKDSKYVLMAIVTFFALITCNVIVDFNYLDAAYLLFLISCVVRYIIICKQDRNE